MVVKSIADVNHYVGSSVNPLATPDMLYELYSVPSYDNQYPEIIKGSDIGSNKITIEEGDVLICKINPRINRVWVVKHYTDYPLLASSEWIVIRNKSLDSNYLKWYFSSPVFRELLVSQVAGIGGSLTRAQPKQVAKYPVPIPDRNDQHRIATILDKVSALISLRKQQLAKLDELVKARFVEMFGDPVRNPYNWDKVDLSHCVSSIDNGKSFICESEPRKSNWPAVLKLSAVTYGTFRQDENKAVKDAKDFIADSEIRIGDLLFTRKNTPDLVGMSAYVFYCKPNLMMPDLIFRLNTNKKCSKIFLWQLINHDLFRQEVCVLASGSAKSMSNISKERLSHLQIICPPMELQYQFAHFVERTHSHGLTIQQSLDKLEMLKKALMQEYFG